MSKRLVCIDSCIFIALGRKKEYPNEVIAGITGLLSEIEKGDTIGVASSFILTELLDGSLEVLERAFDNRKGHLIDVDPPIAALARTVRNKILKASKPLDAADCVYIATAITYKCDCVVTVDGLSVQNGVLSISTKHKMLSAAPEVLKEFGMRICTPMDAIDQQVMHLPTS